MAETAAAEKIQYQGQMHLLQKEMMGRYFERVTRAAEKSEGKAVYMLISGNPVELIQAFDLIPVYPEIDALQLAVKKSALPFILKAEELGYSMDNCAYVKADVGLFLGDRKTPFATIPLPSPPFLPFPPGYDQAQSPIPHLTHTHGIEVLENHGTPGHYTTIRGRLGVLPRSSAARANAVS